MSDHHHDHAHSHPHPEPKSLAYPREPIERGAGRGRILYLDAASGIAGDMLVAGLLDLGVPQRTIEAGLAGIEIGPYQLQVQTVLRSGIAATHFAVLTEGTQPSRDYRQIVQLLERTNTLTNGARVLALRAFEILAEAEAEVHACAIDQVHFHEVGAVDSIVDIASAAIAIDHLGAEIQCSPLPLGRGSTRSQHGIIPLPAPATVLCLRGIPTYDARLDAELVTPTGACLVAAAAHSFGAWPKFRPERVGMSAGSREWPDRPNLLRLVLGTADAPGLEPGRSHGKHVVVEANVDDLSPEVAAFALSRALDAGALDAWTTPIGMKKGRAAQTLSVLCERDKLDQLAHVLLSETTTLGLRFYPVDRIERSRRFVQVETRFGRIQVKVAGGDGLDEHAAPEYEDCRRAAEAHGVPIRKVYAAALAALEAQRPPV